MTIKEMETRCHLDRANIRFYEKEGLLNPARLANGYRDYSEEDVETLLRIKLLRALQVSLEDIKQLQQNPLSLQAFLHQHQQTLARMAEQTAAAQHVSKQMEDDGTTYDQLDAEKYLRLFETQPALVPEGDQVERVQAPWRRFFAFGVDLGICQLIWLALRHLLLPSIPSVNQSWAWDVVDTFASLVLYFLLGALCLSRFAATPGKAIWGFRVEGENGQKLTLQQALNRSFFSLRYGCGFQIPIYSLYRLYRSYQDLKTAPLPWEEGSVLTLKDKKGYRIAVFLLAYAASFSVILFFTFSELQPPNKGPLTVAEFSQNFNYYIKLFQGDPYHKLNENGQWEEDFPENRIVISNLTGQQPTFVYDTDENGHIRSVSFFTENEDPVHLMSSNQSEMLLVSYSLVGARQKNPFDFTWSQAVDKQIQAYAFNDFSFTVDGVEMQAYVVIEDYLGSGAYRVPKEDGNPYCSIDFSATILE